MSGFVEVFIVEVLSGFGLQRLDLHYSCFESSVSAKILLCISDISKAKHYPGSFISICVGLQVLQGELGCSGAKRFGSSELF